MSEKDIDDAMREIRIALLEADVSLPVVKEFIAKVKEQSVGEKVVRSIQPGQMVVKIVHDELVKLLGGEGFFHTIVTGPGRVWLQTMPISSVAAAISGFIPSGN